jgi:hypothetical protein
MLSDHVEPLTVPGRTSRAEGIDAMLFQPFAGIQKIELLAPQHAGQRLPHHPRCVFGSPRGGYRLIERIGLGLTLFHDMIEFAPEGAAGCRIGKP